MNINTDLNDNEVLVLRALVNQMLKCTGGEFGYMGHVDKGDFTKHQFAGYISSLKEKGAFEYLDNLSSEEYEGQYAIKEYIMNQFVK